MTRDSGSYMEYRRYVKPTTTMGMSPAPVHAALLMAPEINEAIAPATRVTCTDSKTLLRSLNLPRFFRGLDVYTTRCRCPAFVRVKRTHRLHCSTTVRHIRTNIVIAILIRSLKRLERISFPVNCINNDSRPTSVRTMMTVAADSGSSVVAARPSSLVHSSCPRRQPLLSKHRLKKIYI